MREKRENEREREKERESQIFSFLWMALRRSWKKKLQNRLKTNSLYSTESY